jgi:hypothetical protein
LTNGYLTSHHNAQYNLMSYIPEYTLEGYKKIIPDRVISNRDEAVVLSRVLPDAVNQGYKDMESSVIYSVNDIIVKDIKHLADTISKAKGKSLKIITDVGNMIIVDLDQARKKNQTILDNYQVHKDRSNDLL